MKVQLLGYSEVHGRKDPNWIGYNLNVLVLEPQGRYQVQHGKCVSQILVGGAQYTPSEMSLNHIIDLQSGFGSTFIDKVVDLGLPK